MLGNQAESVERESARRKDQNRQGGVGG